MSMIPRGTQVPARWRLLACGLVLIASCSIAAAADGGGVDVHALPKLEGAVEDSSRPESWRLEYRMPTPEAVTAPAVKKLLSADGWVPYLRPLEEKNTTLNFKKGRQGLSVYLTQGLGRPDQSMVHYSSDRIYSNVPFPDGASDIMFDGTRPYLGCIAPSALEATSDFFGREMAAIGWQKLTPETAARWTTSLDETVPNGFRAFYAHPDNEATGFYRQKPIMLTLTRRDDGRTNVDIRVAPFALPGDLKADSDLAGLPRPNPTKTARASAVLTPTSARCRPPRWPSCRRCWPSIIASSPRAAGRRTAARRSHPAMRWRSRCPRPRKPACCGSAANMISP